MYTIIADILYLPSVPVKKGTNAFDEDASIVISE